MRNRTIAFCRELDYPATTRLHMSASTDRIERRILLKAPRARVWRALTNPEEFGNWFGVNLKGARFEPGRRVQGQITIPGYEHVVWDVWIERLEPQRLFAWRWHPAAIETGVDYSQEPTTLVEFELTEVDGGTLLSVVESGFDRVPPHRRLDAFRMNSEGWAGQMENVERHVAAA
jgi:uncharacterized protein YndB with AHSA1/START domain